MREPGAWEPPGCLQSFRSSLPSSPRSNERFTALTADPTRDLMSFLDVSWPRLERGFDAWLRVKSTELMR